MKRIITTLLVFFLLTQSAFSQMKSLRYNAVKIQSKQEFTLNSGTRMGGKPRASIKVDLPENTIKWYYSFSTAPEHKPTDTKDLFGKIANTLINSAANSNPITAVGKMILDKAIAPTGSNVVDIYVADLAGSQAFMEKNMFGIYKYSSPGGFAEGTRENIKSGTVEIDDVKQGTIYLCFRNPSQTEAVTFGIEVVAIVQEQVLINTVWSVASKKHFYEVFYEFYKKQNISDNTAKAISGCIVEKVMLEKTPEEYESMNEGALTNWLQPIKQSCIEKYLPKKSEQQKKGITFGNLGWKEYENGNLDKAIEYSKKSLTFDSTLGMSKANLGLFHLIKADESTATDYYVEAISDFNNDKKIAKTSFEGAIDDIDKALVKYPTMKGYQSIRDLLVLELKKYK